LDLGWDIRSARVNSPPAKFRTYPSADAAARRFELIETTSRYAYDGRIAVWLELVVALHAVSSFSLGAVKCPIGKP
jgi:hypothetical protein